MKWTLFRVNDSVHFFVERLTNPTAPEREPVVSLHKAINCPITDKSAAALSIYSSKSGPVPKGSTQPTYNKGDLCALLITSYWKAWNRSDNNWQANEIKELKKICIEYVHEMRRSVGSNVGAFKITKQMMFSAIIHRLATTQDLKDFFGKML
jgi:hypothetical protein